MTHPLEVIIDARMLLPQRTGVGSYLMGLVSGLRQVPGEQRIELWLQSGLTADHPAWTLQGEGIHLRRLDLAHMTVRQHWLIPLALRHRRPDVFHYPHFDLPWGVPGKVVATIHDLKYIARPDFFPQQGRAKRLVMLSMMRHTVRRAKRVIAVSESTRQDVIRRLGTDPGRIKVIPEGVDPVFFSTPDPETLHNLRARYHLEEPYLLFVGERRPHKNLTGLLRAFQAYQGFNPRAVHLVIAGKRYADYHEPERLADALGLNQVVHFLDYVPQDDLPGLYRGAEAFVLLSRYEGFGIPLLEAMASGVPVVYARNTSLPEVAGEAGVPVAADEPEQVAEAVERVMPGGELREETIARGLARARQFTWLRCAQETLALYREAAGQ